MTPDCIVQLSDAVASQIAAGEVVQRPASVLKELVENAIDARSTSIQIYLKDAGKTQIQVIDDGIGMSPADARRAFLRHATSKIRDVHDLYAIHSLGFRGEALASIASVSEVVLRTRRPEDEMGTEVRLAGDGPVSQEPVACAAGSDFSIRNLFYNIPVRRKFLKSDATELGHCLTEFRRIALTRPETAFTLYHNKTEIFRLTASNRLRRIVHIFGQAMQKQLIGISADTTLARISGYVARPEYARKSPGEQYFFANGRYIRHSLLHKAVLQAFAQLIPPNSLPVYFIWIDVDPDTIDINIHPTKVDVKFENEQAVFQILCACIKEALGKFNILPPIDFESEHIVDAALRPVGVQLPEMGVRPQYTSGPAGGVHAGQNITLPWGQLHAAFEQEAPAPEPLRTEAPLLPGMEAKISEAVPEGAAGTNVIACQGRFIVTSVRQGLMFVDRKRAYERILYEYYLNAWHAGSVSSQQCIFPETLELSVSDYGLCVSLKDHLSNMGYHLAFDDETCEVKVLGQPADFDGRCNALRILESLLDEYRLLQDEVLEPRECLARILARLMALSYGRDTSPVDLQHLVEELLTCSTPNTTPSGQKIIHILLSDDIEQWFNISRT
ncbi:MAG: DNA mismatch repair endonuclease MutL [Bacteroidales bacterium]|nr:DNA mismatch repair endonuclease MutL [Bacteroidales bacterium]